MVQCSCIPVPCKDIKQCLILHLKMYIDIFQPELCFILLRKERENWWWWEVMVVVVGREGKGKMGGVRTKRGGTVAKLARQQIINKLFNKLEFWQKLNS